MEKYSPMVERYLDRIGKLELISNHFLAQVVVRELMALISTWMTDPVVETQDVFVKKFMYALSTSPAEILRQD